MKQNDLIAIESSIPLQPNILTTNNSRTNSVFAHEWCFNQSNGQDEVPPIILMVQATATVGDKIRIMVRAMVIRIQV